MCSICLRILKQLNKSDYSYFVCGYFNCKVRHSTQELINDTYRMLPWEQEEADMEADAVRLHEVIVMRSMHQEIPIDTSNYYCIFHRKQMIQYLIRRSFLGFNLSKTS
jgi:hypothetical protein